MACLYLHSTFFRVRANANLAQIVCGLSLFQIQENTYGHFCRDRRPFLRIFGDLRACHHVCRSPAFLKASGARTFRARNVFGGLMTEITA
jgi:hypothetical protein